MKAMRHEKVISAGQPGQFIKHPVSIRHGLTLVELLVVATIMLMLLAISVPAIKPMLETNKTRDTADMISALLNQSRLRAIETGRPCGVRFERYLGVNETDQLNNSFTAYPYNGACVVIRQVAEPEPYGGCIVNSRIAVDSNGRITSSQETAYWGLDSSGKTKLVQNGDLVQFDYKGPKYTLRSCRDEQGSPPSDYLGEINWREYDPNAIAPDYSNGVPFKVFRKEKPTLAAPVKLPQGIIVDLHSSGKGGKAQGGYWDYLNSPYNETIPPPVYIARDDFSPNNQRDISPVTIMFRSDGSVYFASGSRNNSRFTDHSPVYLNVGLWDRTQFWKYNGSNSRYELSNDLLPEDSLNNYTDLLNYWVTVFPSSGNVVIQPVALSSTLPSNPEYPGRIINDSRKYAKDQQGTGGR